MRLLLRTSDLSYFESVRIALETANVPCRYSDFIVDVGWTVEVLHDHDLERAQRAVNAVVVGADDAPLPRAVRVALLAFLAGALLWILAWALLGA